MMKETGSWGSVPAGENAIFECPRCGAQSSYWTGAVSFARLGKACSTIQCSACHEAARLDHVSYPMVFVEVK